MPKSEAEQRFYSFCPEVRENEAGKPRITGYAAVFNSFSEDLGGFVEKLEPGAFARSLSDGTDVRALYAHDTDRIIGRVSNGTLLLAEDDRGLKVMITPPDTNDGRDCVELVRNGYIKAFSFGFFTKKDDWQFPDSGPPQRTVKDLELVEVSLVNFPAYPQTSAAVRSLSEAKKQAEVPAVVVRRPPSTALWRAKIAIITGSR